MAELEADKCSKHHGCRLKGTAGSKRYIPMKSVQPLAAGFNRLKSGHAPVSRYLKLFRNRNEDKCRRPDGGGRTAAQTREISSTTVADG